MLLLLLLCRCQRLCNMNNGNSLGWSGGAYWKCRTQKPIALISQQQQKQQFELWTRQQKENLVWLWLYLFLFKLCAWKKSHALTRPPLSLSLPLCKEIKKQQKNPPPPPPPPHAAVVQFKLCCHFSLLWFHIFLFLIRFYYVTTVRNVFDKFIFINSNFSVSDRAESADMNWISPLIELLFKFLPPLLLLAGGGVGAVT